MPNSKVDEIAMRKVAVMECGLRQSSQVSTYTMRTSHSDSLYLVGSWVISLSMGQGDQERTALRARTEAVPMRRQRAIQPAGRQREGRRRCMGPFTPWGGRSHP